MLWIKAFHIIFVVTWFAGLFYLPRLFVYHAMSEHEKTQEILRLMQRKLLGITNIGGALALIFGIWLVAIMPVWLNSGWMHFKLVLVVGLIFYHVWCIKLVGQFQRGEVTHSHVWFRWFNEAPAVLLVAVVLLVVLKPF
ncbi:MAG TPA: CopD family protein [Xanthomonadales bacterium]|nr:CopD family protein [Xanthomonadales bacterium]